MKNFSYSFALINIIIFISLKGQVPPNKKNDLPYSRGVEQISIDQRKAGWVYKGTNSLLFNRTDFSN